MDEFFGAFVDLLEAKKEYQDARGEYKGYSWDYAGARYALRVNEAETRLAAAMTAIIDERLKEKIAEFKALLAGIPT